MCPPEGKEKAEEDAEKKGRKTEKALVLCEVRELFNVRLIPLWTDYVNITGT